MKKASKASRVSASMVQGKTLCQFSFVNLKVWSYSALWCAIQHRHQHRSRWLSALWGVTQHHSQWSYKSVSNYSSLWSVSQQRHQQDISQGVLASPTNHSAMQSMRQHWHEHHSQWVFASLSNYSAKWSVIPYLHQHHRQCYFTSLANYTSECTINLWDLPRWSNISQH